ncbi:pyridoxamine 5'-phosphate oxidase family protein [Maridesulfovibrio sp. FT414]|uniref:pyridoxamine 5'-phosphate oxidase family protein n=1 Tax=Maridesulfovibrio sp. FT414 TaxID=2979469 RepID=UPI003D802483
MQAEVTWKEVEKLFSEVKHVSVATVDSDGMPRVSPIGSVTFTGENRGYYFEKFPEKMRANLERD